MIRGLRARLRAGALVLGSLVAGLGAGAPGASAQPAGEGGAAEPAVAAARVHLRAGRTAEARRVLEEAARAAPTAAGRALAEGELGRVAFYEGRPSEAAVLLRGGSLAPGQDPATRTRFIELLDAVSRADSAEAATVGEVLYAALREPAEFEATRLLRTLAGVPESGARPALLLLAAREVAAAGGGGEADRLLRHLVERYPGEAEAPLAMLELGRRARAADPDTAREWLERLVLEHPDAAVSPVARRLLAELESRVPSP